MILRRLSTPVGNDASRNSPGDRLPREHDGKRRARGQNRHHREQRRHTRHRPGAVSELNDLSEFFARSGCAPSSLAPNDVIEWANHHVVLLRSGSGTVSRNGNIFTVSVSWVEPGNLNNSISVNVQL